MKTNHIEIQKCILDKETDAKVYRVKMFGSTNWFNEYETSGTARRELVNSFGSCVFHFLNPIIL